MAQRICFSCEAGQYQTLEQVQKAYNEKMLEYGEASVASYQKQFEIVGDQILEVENDANKDTLQPLIEMTRKECSTMEQCSSVADEIKNYFIQLCSNYEQVVCEQMINNNEINDEWRKFFSDLLERIIIQNLG